MQSLAMNNLITTEETTREVGGATGHSEKLGFVEWCEKLLRESLEDDNEMQSSDEKKQLEDKDIILLRTAMRIGVGEMKKIIDDAIARIGRDPLENYYLLIEELERFRNGKKSK